MKNIELLQATILSGAIGYVSLSVLQYKGAVTNYLSNRAANAVCVLFGILDYIIFLLVNALIKKGCSELLLNGLIKKWCSGLLQISITISVTAIVALAIAYLIGKATKSREKKVGNQSLAAREQAFQNPGTGKGIRVDIFQMDGSAIASGYIKNFDVGQNLSGDVTLLPLQDGEKAAKNEEDVINAKRYQRMYLDFNNSVKYYITITFLAA